jgi:predicted DNA-binding protein YlxM (UPF0122 family)
VGGIGIMRLNKVGRIEMLYDFYGDLLTDRQKMIMQLYYEQDLSLGEIANELQISRQAVADNLKRSEAALEKYEEKMKLLAGYLQEKDASPREGRS